MLTQRKTEKCPLNLVLVVDDLSERNFSVKLGWKQEGGEKMGKHV